MRTKTVYVLVGAVLFPILEKVGVECSQHGLAATGSVLLWAAALLKLVLLIPLLVLLVAMSRQTLKRRALCVLAVALLFPVLQKAGIECSQHGFAVAGSCLVSGANLLKPGFLILLMALLIDLWHLPAHRFLRVPLVVLYIPVLLVVSLATVLSGRIIQDISCPIRPDMFMQDQTAVEALTKLANEMIHKQHITWVGNSQYRFVFALRFGNAEYQFASTHIPPHYDFRTPVEAEDMSKVQHFDSLFLNNALKPTDKVLLDPNDYAFCGRVSKTIRRIGFDNMQLYPKHNVVQFQIYDFIGWDNGWRYVYYFCPSSTLLDGFTYDRQLNANWYFARKPRFSDR